MNAFWKNLHGLTQGLLEQGGYLGGRFPAETTDHVARRTAPKNAPKTAPSRAPRRPVAAPLAPCP